ncbi:type II toxin-antitoxin system Phd/YefM family antitoxin [Actinopolymorpha alba]|uniref:type II toxin-antitoxin system Phd/YefM family antitoxin n=1 Tax=Actinopolymorpha alba TaxID=533267 RepID=UPI0004774BCE|nr:type II toxin-antitoxin system Phd/YefM family antitoxin [Actinopolymorpha alba]
MQTLPLATVRNRLSALVEEVARTQDVVTITRNGVPSAVLLSADDYESIMETLDLLGDPESLRRLAEAEASHTSGDTLTGEEMEALLRERLRREAGAA